MFYDSSRWSHTIRTHFLGYALRLRKQTGSLRQSVSLSGLDRSKAEAIATLVRSVVAECLHLNAHTKVKYSDLGSTLYIELKIHTQNVTVLQE